MGASAANAVDLRRGRMEGHIIAADILTERVVMPSGSGATWDAGTTGRRGRKENPLITKRKVLGN